MKNFVLIAAGIVLACGAHADEIYKWVDKDGKTHYSSSKAEAEAAGATTRKLQAPPPPAGGSPAPYSPSSNAEIIRGGSQPVQPIDGRYSPPAAPKQVVRNYRSEDPADKCQLARDILSGVAKHPDGSETTLNERQIAENDVRTFCK